MCIDFRDFRLGSPQIEEQERAVQGSRRTLAVLSPGYLESGFSSLENIMAQHQGREDQQGRLVAVLREPCTPRLGLRISPPLPMTNREQVTQGLPRLLKELRRPLEGAASLK